MTARTPIERAHELGQSIWLDTLSRGVLRSGELRRLVAHTGVRGVTTNPSVFHRSIAHTREYDRAIRRYARRGLGTEQIYRKLVVGDVRRAADQLRAVYRKSHGADGFVSLEVNPHLAHDTTGTVAEAEELWREVGRENLMIKVPATPAGIAAVRTLVGKGININVTLIFSRAVYDKVREAYVDGLEQLAKSGGDVSKVSSVASLFVSRIDSAVDPLLSEKAAAGDRRARTLAGRVAIANARLAYQDFLAGLSSPRFRDLRQQGARPQRLLLASTGTKSPAYPDTLYVDSLIGGDTVNTLPAATLKAFVNHGRRPTWATITRELSGSRAVLHDLRKSGIDLDEVNRHLLSQGLEHFTADYDQLHGAIAEKAAEVRARRRRP